MKVAANFFRRQAFTPWMTADDSEVALTFTAPWMNVLRIGGDERIEGILNGSIRW